MLPAGFKPTISAGKRRQTYLLDRTATATGTVGLTGTLHRSRNLPLGPVIRYLPDRSWCPPSLLYKEYRVFPGAKAARAWRWPPTQSSAEVTVRVELYLYSPSGPSFPDLGWPLHLPLLLPELNASLPFLDTITILPYMSDILPPLLFCHLRLSNIEASLLQVLLPSFARLLCEIIQS